ncbi:hypothetical protein ACS0PU_002680 [Formica fusca]
MYPTEGSLMNYYVPIQDADETSPCKKKKCNNISSEPRRAVRILGRRLNPDVIQIFGHWNKRWSCILRGIDSRR